MASGRIFRQLRIALLLFILLLVAGDAWLAGSRATDWDDALWVVIYPINPDGGAVAAGYISSLRNDVFSPVGEFFLRQAGRYGLAQKELVKVRLGPEVETLPPVPPEKDNVLAVVWWSLKLRFWAMRTGLGMDGPPADIRIYVIYHDPARQPRLAHSLGLKEGLIGVVNAYASRTYSGRNNFVIAHAHEMLHTLGATDKYDQASSQPLYPEGYAQQPAALSGGLCAAGAQAPLSTTHG